MEDIIALALVVGVVAIFVAIMIQVRRKIKKQIEERAKSKIEADKYWEDLREKKKTATYTEKVEGTYVPDQWNPVSKPQQYANVLSGTNKTKPKKETYTTSTSTAGSLDVGDVITGALVLNELFSHKTGGSDPIDFPKTQSSSSWGLDDSDSRKSISDSMDTSSSWSSSSSDFGSSDSGPSSDW